jgi:hypothetical protein
VTTPEGKVKKLVRDALNDTRIWSFWPVPSGYQAATLDVLCAVRVRHTPVFFVVEVKKPGEKPTERQDLLMNDLRLRLNVKSFVIDGPEGVKELKAWLTRLWTME